MAIFVTTDWVGAHLDSPDLLILDPRRPTQYLQGHLRNAVNLPLGKAYDHRGCLRSVDELVAWIDAAGLGTRKTPLLYDASDGQSAAMLAWLLEYLGRNDVHLMDVFLEGWVSEGRGLFYRPVQPVPETFVPRVEPGLRATLADVRQAHGVKLTDFRSRDEYAGRLGPEGRSGHIPGAVNLVWQALLGENHRFLATREKVLRLAGEVGITQSDQVMAYCQTGPRAAVGYLALRKVGLDVRLFDGSYAEWTREGLPIEVVE